MATNMRFDAEQERPEDRQAFEQLLAPAAPGKPVAPAGVPGMAAPIELPPIESTPASSIFQSDNRSIGGYLIDAMNAKRGDIIKFGNEDDRKRETEAYIRSLVPEIEARGGKVGDIRNEKIQIDGKWRDLLRDIGGEAGAQYIEPGDGDVGAAGAAMSGMAPGQGQTGLTNALMDGGFFQQLMAQLKQQAGPEADDRAALERLLTA